MDIAVREIDRLNQLISEFLDFVKPEKFRCLSVGLQGLISDIVVTMKSGKDFAKKIQVRENYLSAVALANNEKLKQVVWNLLMNAVQSMPTGGTIEVGCSPVNEQRVKILGRGSRRGNDGRGSLPSL